MSQFGGPGGIDRGGINYVIEAQFEGRQSVEQFKQTIDDLRRRVNALKSELASVQPPVQGRGQQRDTARQRQQEARATEDQARASERAAKSEASHVAATRQYDQALRRRRVSQQQAIEADRRSHRVERERLTALEQLQRATLRFTQATDRLALAEAGRLRAADAGARGNLKEAASHQRAADAINRRVAAQRRLEAARQPLDDAELRRTTLQADALQKQFAIQRRLAALQNERLGKLQAEEIAQRRIRAVEQERQARAILAAQGRDARGRLPGDVPATTGQRGRRPADEFAALRKELTQTEGAANRISFTFRRLFGILAAFTAARLAVGAFNNAIRETIRFMAQLEITTSGFAALLTATTDVFDQFGRVQDPQRRLALAMQESRRQMSLLRIEALQTANTFDDLVRVFTAALAPGITAGLAVDEVRRLTLLVAQAGASIGVDAQRIETDIRAILEGTISQQRTGIARALGITDQEVRQAREAGRLFQFLEQRLQAFAVAGEDAQGTFTILSTNLRDAFLQIGQVGLLPLFENLRGMMSETLDIIRTVNEETGDFQLNPRAVAIVQQIGDGLGAAAGQLREMRQEISFEQALGAARAFSQTLQVGAEIIRGVVQGMVEALDDIRRIFGPVFSALRGIGLFDEDSLGNVVALITRIFIIYTAFNTIVGGTLRTFGGLVISMNRMVLSARDLALFWGQTARNAGAAAVSAQAAAGATAQASAAATGAAGASATAAASTGLMAARWTAVRSIAARTGTIVLRFVPVIGVIVTGLFIVRSLMSDSTRETGRFRNELDRAKRTIEEAAGEADGLSVSFQRSISPLEDNVRLVERLRDNIREARRQFDIGFGTLGLEGAVADIRRTRLEAELGLEDELRETTQQRLEVVRDLARVRQQLREQSEVQSADLQNLQSELRIAERIVATRRERGETPRPVEFRRVQQIEDAIARRQEDQSRTGAEINRLKAEEQGLSENLLRINTELLEIARKQEQATANIVADIARRRAFEIQQQADVARAEIESARRVADARRRLMTDPTFSVAEMRREEAEAELNILEARFAAERALRERNLRELRRDIGTFADRAVEFDIIPPAAAEILRSSEDDSERQQALNTVLEQRLTILEKIADVESRKEDPSEGLALLQNEEEFLRRNLAAVESLIQLENMHKQEKEDSLRVSEQQSEELREQQRIINDITDIISAPIQFGALQGFTAGIQEIGDGYTQMFNALRRTVIGFRNFIADSIVSAFDPTDDTTIQERFRRFLLDIARMFVQTLVGMAIQAAILNALSGGILGGFFGEFFGGGRQQGGPVGFQKGGRVGYRAEGMAGGGRVPSRPVPRKYRPSHIHRRDSVPIWADPREWVMRPQAVAKYGDGFMAAVNEARLDPYQLAPLAGMQSSSSSPRVSASNAVERGMQAGGQVGGVRSSQPQMSGPSESSERSTTVLPVLPASESTMEMLTRGGRNALLRFLQEEGFQRG